MKEQEEEIKAERERIAEEVQVGMRIKIFWPLDVAWYAGTVEAVDAEGGLYRLRYDDGEDEEIMLEKECWAVCGPEDVPAPPPVEPIAGATEVTRRGHGGGEEVGEAEDNSDEDKEYFVEKIHDKRTLEDGTIEYLVNWEGYADMKDFSWETVNIIEQAGVTSNLIEAYEAALHSQVPGTPDRPTAAATSSPMSI